MASNRPSGASAATPSKAGLKPPQAGCSCSQASLRSACSTGHCGAKRASPANKIIPVKWVNIEFLWYNAALEIPIAGLVLFSASLHPVRDLLMKGVELPEND